MPEANARSFLKDYAQTSTQQPVDDTNEYRAFAFGRVGSRTQTMLTFFKQDDYVEALSYANLNRIWSSDINRELKLDFGDRQVSIEGSNLQILFRYISLNRCSEINEQSQRSPFSVVSNEPVITKLSIQSKRLDP